MRKSLLAVVIALVAARAHAQDLDAAPLATAPVAPTKVAVLELAATGLDPVVARNLTELFTSEAGRIPGYSIIGHSEVKDMVGFEIEKQTLGCSEASCFAEIGGALGVDLIVSGTLGKVGETFVINLRLIDIKRGETKHRIGETLAGRVELLPDYMRTAAWRLFEQPVPKDVMAAYEQTRARLAGATAKDEAPPAESRPAPAAQKVAQAAPTPAARTTPKRPWQTVAKSVSMAVAVLGGLGGTGLYAFSFYKQETEEQVDESTIASLRENAHLAFGAGAVGLAAAIVFAILEPEPEGAAVRMAPAAGGLALTF